ncbi:secretin N-terminal domain-containing protein [Candidatus Margulisiibacteriota bacterium]
MKIKSTLVLLFVLFTFTSIHAELIDDTFYISPLFTDPVQTTSVFTNPAEIAHWKNIAGLDLRYRPHDSSFSGTLTLKTPDFFLGNFALSMEAFGTDFGSNLIWVPEDTNNEGHFSLTKGGQKFVFGWAKRLEQVTFGIDAKYYRYRELDTGREETGFGMDAGILYHPFNRLYLGVMVNDFTDTEIYDTNKAILYEVPERIRLTAALSLPADIFMTAGAPLDILSERLDSRETWKKASFSIRKIWDRGMNAELGYNSKDAYAALGYIISDAVNLKAVLSNDLTVKDGKYRALFVCSAVLPAQAWTKISSGLMKARDKTIVIKSDKKGTNPFKFLFDLWVGINYNLITQSMFLDYVDAEKAKDQVSDMLSPDGKIEVDTKRNRLIITDFKDNVHEIMEALRRIDQRSGLEWQQQKRDSQSPQPMDGGSPPPHGYPAPGGGFF